MPNHVTHKILFSLDYKEKVLAECFTDGQFDFEKLVPSPPHKYQGWVSFEDQKDFGCNWLSWNRENWGTRWNAYSCRTGREGDRCYIQFDTAWSIPYPVLSAFANKFSIPFEHRYYDEGECVWGIQHWNAVDGIVCRTYKRHNNPDDMSNLRKELNPDKDDPNGSEALGDVLRT